MKIKKKGYKYSKYRDYLKTKSLDNFGDTCKKCGNEIASKEEVCGKCNKKVIKGE